MSQPVKRRYIRQPERCKVDTCDRAPKAREMCLMHYRRWRNHGTPTPRFRGAVVDGKRLCATCKRDMPAELFRYSKCADCWAETNRQRQHARRAGGGDVFTRGEVLARDGFTCGICREGIDVSLSYPDPMSASLDHIVPLSRGGTHTLANSQAAHLTCNLRKWAHPADRVVC